MSLNLQLGKSGERYAEEYLKSQNYAIIARNFRSKLGEIDIIARHQDTVVFIEVKTRTTLSYGLPAEAIRQKKLHSLIKTSQLFLKLNKRLGDNIRYDAVEVFLREGRPEINHIKNITL